MVIKKIKTEPLAKKEPLIKESAFQKRWRLEEEKEAAEKQSAKQKLIDEAEEKERLESIVIPYLVKLDEQLKEKELHSFWTFPDRKGFKKIKGMNSRKIQEMLYNDVDKYANRTILSIQLMTGLNDKMARKEGVFLSCAISVHNIDKKGKLVGNNRAGGLIGWRLEDFGVSKFSFKLLELIIEPVANVKLIFNAVIGRSFTRIVGNLRELGYKTDDILNPLAGINV